MCKTPAVRQGFDMDKQSIRNNQLVVPTSIGELADKITILRIKTEEIKDEGKLKNISAELAILKSAYSEYVECATDSVNTLIDKLFIINKKLWVIEDDLRDMERDKRFDGDFIELARAVYFTNDERARLKRQINIELGSLLVEEKSYATYA